MVNRQIENQNKMPTSEQSVPGDSKEKSQRGSQKGLREPEELADETRNQKLYFEESHTEVEGGSSLCPWLLGSLQLPVRPSHRV